MKSKEFISELSVYDPGIQQALEQKGYTFLNSGADQEAYLEPGTGQVLKIFNTQRSTKGSGGSVMSEDQEMFATFSNYCKANANNEFLPKFSGWKQFTFNDHTYLQIRMERLTELTNLQMKYVLKFLRISVEFGLSPEEVFEKLRKTAQSDYKFMIANYGEAKLLQLITTMCELYQIGQDNGFDFDLHPSNFMMRGNTLVITDPWII